MLTHELLARRLRDILDPETDCDAARLEYADLLEETGESERAEFIRVQVALARHEQARGEFQSFPPPDGWLPFSRRDALRRREREILDAPGAWDLRIVFPSVDSFGWRRGFTEWVRVPADWWLAHADALLARHPVRAATLTTWPEWQSWPMVRAQIVTDTARLRGRVRYHTIDTQGSRRSIILDLLRAEWPTVQTWHLPEA